MKVNCQGLSFASAIQRVSKAISKKGIPILECIKIDAYGNNVKLLATDGELSIEKIIAADVLTEGTVVIPYKGFVDFAQAMVDTEIELFTAANKLTIKYGENECKFNCLNTEDFPAIDAVDKNNVLTLKLKVLKDMIVKTIYAVATGNNDRDILKGCYFHTDDNKLTVVALDGYRMSIFSTKEYSCESGFNINVPLRAVSELLRLEESDDKEIEVIISGNKIMVDLGHTRIISRLIKGDFIKYKNILPSDFSSTIIFNKAILKNALSRINLLIKSNKNTEVDFKIEENGVMMYAKSDEGNSIEERIEASLEGKEIEIAFNIKNILDVLGAVDEEYISFEIKNSSSACIIKTIGNENFIGLVLPLRTR